MKNFSIMALRGTINNVAQRVWLRVRLFDPLFYTLCVMKINPGGVHNMLRVRVCAAHMGGFLGPKFSKQRSIFQEIFHKQGWVIQKLAKNSKKWVVFRQNSS